MININNSNDPFYRYKMPKLIIKYEGDKTSLINIKEVAHSLKRNHITILSYFGHILGTQCSDKKEKYIINGIFLPDVVNEHLFHYINEYVLCTKCSNPETIFKKNKDNLVSVCSSCGHKRLYEDNKIVKLIKKTL